MLSLNLDHLLRPRPYLNFRAESLVFCSRRLGDERVVDVTRVLRGDRDDFHGSANPVECVAARIYLGATFLHAHLLGANLTRHLKVLFLLLQYRAVGALQLIVDPLNIILRHLLSVVHVYLLLDALMQTSFLINCNSKS